ncbi:MAG: hypothetical protein U1F51_11625 [Burkholderiales bacterium]
MPTSSRGIAFTSDGTGAVDRLVVDEWGLLPSTGAVDWIASLIEPASQEDARQLLAALHPGPPVFGWCFGVLHQGKSVPLQFAMARHGETVLVAAGECRLALLRVYETLVDACAIGRDAPAAACDGLTRAAARDDDRADTIADTLQRISTRLAAVRLGLDEARHALDTGADDASR